MIKIYKIEFGDYIYYGSTKQKKLCKRQSRHNENLKNNSSQKLYRKARENNINKLICVLLFECNEEERFKKENDLIQGNVDKILLNERLAYVDPERRLERHREINKKYYSSEKGIKQRQKSK